MSSSKKESMCDAAYNCLVKHKNEMPFSKLWQAVVKTLEIPEELQSRKKAQFYSELMLDTRFASLKGNTWDLRNRRSFEEVHIGQNLIDEFDDDTDEIEEEEETQDVVKSEEEY